jgi:ribA/ribD-fused uncharacterized protein
MTETRSKLTTRSPAGEHYSEGGTLFFFGGWLSSFAPYRFTASPMAPMFGWLRGFETREHYFAAHNTLDVQSFEVIRRAASPGEAKDLGRNVFLRPGWDDGISFAVMLEAIRIQLMQHNDLRAKLLATGDRQIAEDSPTDFIWGIRDATGGMGGKNLLGKAWMVARAELRALRP